MWKTGCPKWQTCPQWCWRVVPGWQGQANCLERTQTPPECGVWLGLGLPHGNPSRGRPDPTIPLELVIKAINLMKCGKAAGTSPFVAEMPKASGVKGNQQIRDLIEDHCLPLQGQGPCLWARKLSRRQVARPGHKGSRTFYDNKCTSMTCSLVSCLDTAPLTPYSFYASYKKT